MTGLRGLRALLSPLSVNARWCFLEFLESALVSVPRPALLFAIAAGAPVSSVRFRSTHYELLKADCGTTDVRLPRVRPALPAWPVSRPDAAFVTACESDLPTPSNAVLVREE